MENVRLLLGDSNRFFDRFRRYIRSQNLAWKTEKTYCSWVKRYILFHKKRHPENLTRLDVESFLHDLAVNRNVAVNTQRAALNALSFLYNRFLDLPLGELEFTGAKKSPRIPVVFSHPEAVKIMAYLASPYKLLASMMYGSGLRVSEVVSLRYKDIDFSRSTIVVRSGKGNRDRVTILPETLVETLKRQCEYVGNLHDYDKLQGYGEVYLPDALSGKCKSAAKSLAWQYLFPAKESSVDPRSGEIRRHHIQTRAVQRKVKQAVVGLGIEKHASCHTFRHSFATQLLQKGYDIRTVQELLGHSDVKITEIYTHVLKQGANAVRSPVDDH